MSTKNAKGATKSWRMVRATSGLGNAGKRFMCCTVCNKKFQLYDGMPTRLTYEVIEGQETICSSCELVVHIGCMQPLCEKQQCKNCALFCVNHE